ncbi:hypothetical protein TEA_028280 [Camellia sinensis var. sinensis]|uniref:Uncharacterized protein n=1 Tax=Camellia sinensis var. sinensis TaxID=542762 RepID=A0A4S4ESA6_CAMSN|nr:hypothetical protein TEA_028280 [Camellia sinensis var. sinensis]
MAAPNPIDDGAVAKEEQGGCKKEDEMMRQKGTMALHTVQVRSVEDGFRGSWHSGTVIACENQARRVQYNHLLCDDGLQPLIDCIKVPPVIDGIVPAIRVVILGSDIKTPQIGLQALARALSQRGIAKKIQVIAKARVPIVKFVEKRSGVAFDISFDLQNGPKAAEFIKNAVSKMPPLRPLCLILKVFLQQRELNEVYTGGIGSYALLAMLIAMDGNSKEHDHPKMDTSHKVTAGKLLGEANERGQGLLKNLSKRVHERVKGCKGAKQSPPRAWGAISVLLAGTSWHPFQFCKNTPKGHRLANWWSALFSASELARIYWRSAQHGASVLAVGSKNLAPAGPLHRDAHNSSI